MQNKNCPQNYTAVLYAWFLKKSLVKVEKRLKLILTRFLIRNFFMELQSAWIKKFWTAWPQVSREPSQYEKFFKSFWSHTESAPRGAAAKPPRFFNFQQNFQNHFRNPAESPKKWFCPSFWGDFFNFH